MKSLLPALIAALALATASDAYAQEIVTLAPRANVNESYFLARIPKTPQAIAILFPGGDGQIQLRNEGGQIKFQMGNFLVRVRAEFVNRNVIVAIPDVPSDQTKSGMSDEFRLGPQHFTDISAVVDDLKKRFPGVPLFLIGTSRGSVSAVPVGRDFGDAIAGIVLTSSLFVRDRFGAGLSGFDYSKLKAPVLLVHGEDACVSAPYKEARRIADSRKYPLVTVHGGKPPESGPCDPFSAHGYFGKEAETVDAIVNWMLKKPYPSNIE